MFSMNLAARDNVIAYSRAHFNVKSDFSSFPTQNDALDVCGSFGSSHSSCSRFYWTCDMLVVT